MKVAVCLFPGSNCDHDVMHAYGALLKASVELVWYRESALGDVDLVVIPGGFSFGDYLRCGALAKVAPIMRSVVEFAGRGGRVLGICNGFQILCEAGLLPGVLLQNVGRKFISKTLPIKSENSCCQLFAGISAGTVYHLPVAHFDGNYFATEAELKLLNERKQIVFRYCSAEGLVLPDDLAANPNGSAEAIAGVCNEQGNVVGLMPHPERAVELLVAPEVLLTQAHDSSVQLSRPIGGLELMQATVR